MSQTNDTSSGVNYSLMDPFKVACQKAAAGTAHNLQRLGFDELSWSRGESAYLFQPRRGARIWAFAHVHEGLGTKNLVADAVAESMGMSYYNHIAQDTIAMAVNDAITLGALPLTISMHLSVGDEHWFNNKLRWEKLIEGWVNTCNSEALCAWSCGETPTLKDIIVPGTAELSCSVIGLIRKKNHCINSANIQAGDAIIMLSSSGVHANGFTKVRQVASKEYLTKLPGNITFGQALLNKTIIYRSIVEACQDEGILIHYAVNITGHGWRKLMRAAQPYSYVIETLPPVPPEFGIIQRRAGLTDRQMYEAYNMRAGFALIVNPADGARVIEISNQNLRSPASAWKAGHVDQADEHSVVLKPLGITYEAEELKIR